MRDIHSKEIAVVGVSTREEKFGYKIFKSLLSHGFTVQGVNPRGGLVLGRKIFKSIRDLPRVPDIVITVVPPEVTERIVDECSQMGVRQIWMQPGSESKKAIEKAMTHGLSVTHNDCFMAAYDLW